MDNFFPYFQLGGCVTFSILALMLIFSRTFESKHYYIYNRSRLMLIASMTLLAIHFAIQFYTGWRMTDPTKAIMVNLVFFPMAGLLMIYSLLYMLLKEDLNLKKLFWVIWAYCTILAILFYAYLNPKILYPVECIGSVSYTIICIVIAYSVNKQFNIVRTRIDNYFSQDTVSHTNWIARVILMMILFVSMVPLAILFNNDFLKCISLLNFATIFFFVNRFIYYGYDIQKMIDRYYEAVEADLLTDESDEETADHVASEAKYSVDNHQEIEAILEEWKEKKSYTEPEITIEDVVRQTKLRRSPLTNYLNNILGHSFRSWLNSLRIEEAKEIMYKHPDYSHETIADLSGFSSRTYFLKVFKDKEGMTPGEWSDRKKKA